jgi:hypothetical protein
MRTSAALCFVDTQEISEMASRNHGFAQYPAARFYYRMLFERALPPCSETVRA